MADALGVILGVEVTVAVYVLVFTVTEDIVTWLADRHVRVIRERRRG